MKQLSLCLLCALAVSGCTNNAVVPTSLFAHDVSAVEVAALFNAEPLASSDEYGAKVTRWRLFGVQTEDVHAAVFADTQTWQVREVQQGALLARNIRVSGVAPDAVFLSFAGGEARVVRPGEEVEAREVRHAFDDVARYQGRGVFAVSSNIVSSLRERHGLGGSAERVELQGLSALRLSALEEEGALARLGLEAEDLVLESPGLDVLVETVAQGATVDLRVLRRGNLLALRYGP